MGGVQQWGSRSGTEDCQSQVGGGRSPGWKEGSSKEQSGKTGPACGLCSSEAVIPSSSAASATAAEQARSAWRWGRGGCQQERLGCAAGEVCCKGEASPSSLSPPGQTYSPEGIFNCIVIYQLLDLFTALISWLAWIFINNVSFQN